MTLHAAEPAEVVRRVTALLRDDPAAGRALVFDLLASEPRLKPSRGLLVDPGDTARRRWDGRVGAVAALLASPAAEPVADELADELAHDPVFAADVRAALPGMPS